MYHSVALPPHIAPYLLHYFRGEIVIKKENIRVAITMPRSLHAELKEIAEYQNRTVSNLIVTILKHYIKTIKKD